ncbi:MAG: hypothetical protein ACE14O_03790 [Candidatus Cloacimonadaceae bacterium]
MNDWNDKLRERWQEKRKKSSNWTSLIIKVVVLLLILYAIAKIGTGSSLDWSKFSPQADSVRTDSVR